MFVKAVIGEDLSRSFIGHIVKNAKSILGLLRTHFFSVEVGCVCGLNCHKPKSSSIRKPSSLRNIIPSIADL